MAGLMRRILENNKQSSSVSNEVELILRQNASNLLYRIIKNSTDLGLIKFDTSKLTSICLSSNQFGLLFELNRLAENNNKNSTLAIVNRLIQSGGQSNEQLDVNYLKLLAEIKGESLFKLDLQTKQSLVSFLATSCPVQLDANNQPHKLIAKVLLQLVVTDSVIDQRRSEPDETTSDSGLLLSRSKLLSNSEPSNFYQQFFFFSSSQQQQQQQHSTVNSKKATSNSKILSLLITSRLNRSSEILNSNRNIDVICGEFLLNLNILFLLDSILSANDLSRSDLVQQLFAEAKAQLNAVVELFMSSSSRDQMLLVLSEIYRNLSVNFKLIIHL